MPDVADITIIGAGVVGLAIAAQVAGENREVYVLEQHETFGKEQTGRTGGGTHAAWFFPPHADSLKAKLVVPGRRMVTELVNKYEIPHEVRRTLKGLTNNDEDYDAVQEMLEIGLRYGGEDLELLSRRELKKLEPHLDAAWAILCPRTLTLDPHALMRCFIAQAMERGTQVVYKSKVIGIEKVADGYKVTIRNGTERFFFTTRLLINCAGLNSEKMAQLVGIDTAKAGYQVHFHRAEEYTVDRAKTALLNSGIDTIALLKGPHIGFNLDGIIRIGLHIKYVDSWDSIDYEYGRLCAMDTENQQRIYDSVKDFMPFLEYDDLLLDQAAVHAELLGPTGDIADWLIRDESNKGLPGFINLIGMDAPAFTSAPSIAEYVGDIVKELSA